MGAGARAEAGPAASLSVVARSSAQSPRQSASRRRRSGGARSAGSSNEPIARSAARSRSSSPSRSRALTERVGARAGRSVSRGSRSSSLRSRSSAARQAFTSSEASRWVSPCSAMTASSRSCCSCASAASSLPRVGPSTPRPSAACAWRESRRPSAKRHSTQARLCPRSRPIALGPSCSSSRSEQTTSASSRGVLVRAGALAASSRCLCSALVPPTATTIGALRSPRSRQRRSRLKPSRSSYSPSLRRATKSGKSGPGSVAPRELPLRSRAYPVCTRSIGTRRTAQTTSSATFVPGFAWPVRSAAASVARVWLSLNTRQRPHTRALDGPPRAGEAGRCTRRARLARASAGPRAVRARALLRPRGRARRPGTR